MSLYYTSTRSQKNRLKSSETIIKGISGDGGLFIPERFPDFKLPLEKLKGYDYRKMAFHIMSGFLDDFGQSELKGCIGKAYDDKFDDPGVVPVVKKAGAYFLELYHGATLAFKDLALSILPHLMTTAARMNKIDEEIVILTATSGDTGKAALESFSDVPGTRIIVFYPGEGVSKIQEKQMITQEGDNTSVIAINGNFDDAQRGVKQIFNDREFNSIAKKANMRLSSANSIKIVRLIPQIVYYIYSYVKLIENGEIKPGEKINIVVPTGNFGNILASYYAAKIGLPVNSFICASNENNVLFEFINTGIYDRNRELILTSSPSMDILVSSNLERLLYDISGRDAGVVNNLVNDLNVKGRFMITGEMKDKMQNFYGNFSTDDEALNAIGRVYNDHGYLIDTHTAVAYDVYKKYLAETGDNTKTLIASTASPFKFPGSVLKAISGKTYLEENYSLVEKLSDYTGIEIPENIKGLDKKPMLHDMVCNKEEMKTTLMEVLNIG